MFASKTEIVLYSVLAAGTFAGLYFDVSVWLLIGFAVLIGLVDIRLSRRRRKGVHETVRGQRKGTQELGPSVQDWALLATSLAFCAAGLFLLMHDWRAAVVTITFFGACGLVFWTNILRKRREKHWQGATVQVAGRVNIYAKGAHMPVRGSQEEVALSQAGQRAGNAALIAARWPRPHEGSIEAHPLIRQVNGAGSAPLTTRADHLRSCKQRALEFVARGDVAGAFECLATDFQRHPETSSHDGLEFGMKLMMSGFLRDPDRMRAFITSLS